MVKLAKFEQDGHVVFYVSDGERTIVLRPEDLPSLMQQVGDAIKQVFAQLIGRPEPDKDQQ